MCSGVGAGSRRRQKQTQRARCRTSPRTPSFAGPSPRWAASRRSLRQRLMRPIRHTRRCTTSRSTGTSRRSCSPRATRPTGRPLTPALTTPTACGRSSDRSSSATRSSRARPSRASSGAPPNTLSTRTVAIHTKEVGLEQRPRARARKGGRERPRCRWLGPARARRRRLWAGAGATWRTQSAWRLRPHMSAHRARRVGGAADPAFGCLSRARGWPGSRWAAAPVTCFT
mmetsp:Transcript_22962/g.67654  ORF Transcript_22962/g.67654 Transcript_22962/m.67654 type:complete len:228 (-) Transcript_22962:222-905(-)